MYNINITLISYNDIFLYNMVENCKLPRHAAQQPGRAAHGDAHQVHGGNAVFFFWIFLRVFQGK